ncbi:MAG: DUF5683 domain-containing protein, partial [Bacteroidales bacterium]|nr:DUF5683 domain-containing protein [Bacteroidales bacterium]
MISYSYHIKTDQIRRIGIMILLFGLFGISSFGQKGVQSSDTDSIRISGDPSAIQTVNPEEMDHSPRKAMIYGLVLPGLGQAYNKKYFKIPFVYAALGGVSYWIYYNTQGYRNISVEYELDDNSTNERYLKAWRRNLELSYISLVGAYALQVLDAYVDANLFFWDVSPDLTIRLQPSIDPLYLSPGMPVA